MFKMNNLVTAVKRTASKTKVNAIKKSPEILTVIAVVGVVGSIIEAAHATTKLESVMTPAKEKLNSLHEAHENPELIPNDVVYTDKDYHRDLALTYFQTGLKLAGLYLPTVALGTVTIGCIIGDHKILSKRNVALSAAYEAAESAFKAYRGRVAERFGKETEEEIRYNVKTQEFEEKYTDEKGKEKTKTVRVPVVDPGLEGYSEYAKFFDEASDQWEDDSEYNHAFLVRAENEFNNRLRVNGHVFLNEVYKYLGIPETKAGQIVGWVYDSKDEFADNHIDFGIHDINRPRVRDFVNGYEKVILLDFNVQGNILDLMN